MIYIYCVGLASLDVVCDEMIVPGILVYGSFLKCVYVYCVKSFAHIKCYKYRYRRRELFG